MTNDHQVELSAPPKPRITLRGILLATCGWLIFSLASAFPVKISSHIPFLWAFDGQIMNHLPMALLSVPVWFIIFRWMAGARWWWHAIVHAIVGPAYAAVTFAIFSFWFRLVAGPQAADMVMQQSLWIIQWNFLLYIIQFAIYHVAETTRRLRFKERQMLELLALSREQELATLKSQINPHFLFNTLNSISAMASHDPEETRTMITQLGDLLRYSTDASRKDVVSLREEIAFVKSYVALEAKRLGERLRVVYEICDEGPDVDVPPMVLQPLVENALKHGIEPSEEGGEVVVSITREQGRICVRVKDTGVGFKGVPAAGAGSGIGLKNTDARLRKTFGDESALWTDAPASGGIEAGFSLPERKRSEQ